MIFGNPLWSFLLKRAIICNSSFYHPFIYQFTIHIMSEFPIACPAVNIIRGPLVESRHRVSACIVDNCGRILFKIGDIRSNVFLRSSMKPLQAAAMVGAGAAEHFGLKSEEIAICAGSHGGEAIHIAAVQSIMAKIGLDAGYLQCGVQPLLDAAANKAITLSGEKPKNVHHNCSGKHAGMLATAVHLSMNVGDYCHPDSDLQHYITEFIARVADLNPANVAIGINGCSAPVHGIPLQNAAMAFARLVEPVDVSNSDAEALRTVADAMRRHPEYVAACQGRICTELMRNGGAVRLTAKSGAEGVYAAGWKNPLSSQAYGLAVKVEDGAQRARDPVVIALLQRFGVLPEELPETLMPFAAGLIKNWAGRTVGSIEVNLKDEQP